MAAFSTQTTVEGMIGPDRLAGLVKGGKSLDNAIAFAGGYISGRLKIRFGQDIIDSWVLPDDVPPLITSISDVLVVWRLNINKPSLFPEAAEGFNDADEMLNKIADGTMTLEHVDAPVSTQYETSRIKSDFDPERLYNNQSVNPFWVAPPDMRELPEYPE